MFTNDEYRIADSLQIICASTEEGTCDIQPFCFLCACFWKSRELFGSLSTRLCFSWPISPGCVQIVGPLHLATRI